MTIVMGIESTAHTIGIGIFDAKRKRLIHSKHMYKAIGEGIIPRKVADHHQFFFADVLRKTLDTASVKLDDVDCISFAQGPGIGQPLQFGCSIARYISLSTGAKLIPVNHCAAHIEIGMYDTGIKDPLVVYVSGGNTQLIVKDGSYRVLGETLDIGMGNLFDVVARELGLKYGHGAELEKLAKAGRYILGTPYSVKGMNITFGGLVTFAKRKKSEYRKEDIAYSIMHNAFAMMTEATERAFCLTNKEGILICGGVAQNKLFNHMLKTMLKQHSNSRKPMLGVPKNEYNADNGAMIAYTGYCLYKRYGRKVTVDPEDAVPKPRWRVDQVAFV